MLQRKTILFMESKNRIAGFDLARAYALFGMFIVNFNTVFGSHTDHSGLSGFLNLFNGNSSTLFVMLAGMGVALMSNRTNYTEEEKQSIRGIVLRRSWFLFFIGLLLYLWWPADILHFYGGYMHIAAFMLFVPRRWYVVAAVTAIVIWHLLLFIIPFETGWDFVTLYYIDFWTVSGFLRNTFYNGWNPILPWIAYFLFGMFLGRLNWQERKTKITVLVTSELVYLATEAIQYMAASADIDPQLALYLTADYLPPALPFMLSTASLGCVILVIALWLGEKIGHWRAAQALTAMGRMTLTHYILSLTIGMLTLAYISGRSYNESMSDHVPLSPRYILIFSVAYFILSLGLSRLWTKYFPNGPFEMLMRKISG